MLLSDDHCKQWAGSWGERGGVPPHQRANESWPGDPEVHRRDP